MPGLVTEFPVIASGIEKALVDERDYQKAQRQADLDCNEEGQPETFPRNKSRRVQLRIVLPPCRSPPNAAPNS